MNTQIIRQGYLASFLYSHLIMLPSNGVEFTVFTECNLYLLSYVSGNFLKALHTKGSDVFAVAAPSFHFAFAFPKLRYPLISLLLTGCRCLAAVFFQYLIT